MLTEIYRKKMTHYFKLWDLNQDGVLEFEEFFTLTRRIADFKGLSPDSLEYQQWQDDTVHRWQDILTYSSDEAKDKMSLPDWLRYCEARLEDAKQNGKNEMDQLVAQYFFNLVDVQQDGVLTLDEWPIFVELMGIKDTPAVHFQKLDVENKGHLSLDDFLQLYEQFFYNENPTDPGNYFYGLFDES